MKHDTIFFYSEMYINEFSIIEQVYAGKAVKF